MKKSLNKTLSAGLLAGLMSLCLCAVAEEPKTSQADGNYMVYVTTLSTGYATTGSKQMISSLFYQKPDSGTDWKYLGRPNNRVFSVAFYPSSKGQIIALATHTGVQQSNDGGKTWKVTSGWQMTEVECVVFDPSNPDILYAGSPYGFYKTTDGGKHWKESNKGLDNIDASFVSSIVIDSANNKRILISTEDGAFESNDSGESWSRIDNITIKNIRRIVQSPYNPKVFAMGTEDNGLYFSRDGGKIWEKSDVGILNNTFYDICFDPNSADIIYAVGFQAGVYKSIDAGKTWKQYFNGLGSLTIRTLAVLPGNSKIVYAGTLGKGVYISTDEGLTWKFAGLDSGHVTTVKIINL